MDSQSVTIRIPGRMLERLEAYRVELGKFAGRPHSWRPPTRTDALLAALEVALDALVPVPESKPKRARRAK